MTLRGAILALATTPDFTVHDGAVPDAPGPRYAVLYAGAGWLTADDLSRTKADHVMLGFQFTSVGRGPAEVEFVARTVRDALAGKQPVAEGWETGVIAHVGDSPIRTDTDRPDVDVFYCTDRYDVSATRA